jgi:hypothetical protein
MLTLLDPRLWLMAALAALCIAGTAFVGGCQHGKSRAADKAAKADLADTRADIERLNTAADVVSVVSTESAARHAQVEVRFQTIEKEVIRYVQTPAAAAVCLDDDGLRLWRAANRGEFDAAASEPAGHDSLPDPGRAGIWGSGQPVGRSRSPGEALPRLPGETGGAGGIHPGSLESTGAAE